MAQSGVTTTTVVVPVPPTPTYAIMEPFWRPTATGNGRIWVSGRAAPLSNLNSVRWRVNGGAWNESVTNVVAGERFGFYVTGDDASEWGTIEVTELTQPVGTYFRTLQVDEKPKIVKANGVILAEVNDLASVASTPQVWYYDWVNKWLYFSTTADAVPTTVQALIDPVFEHGTEYTIEVEVEDSLSQTVTVFNEVFIWPYQVRNFVDRYLKVLLPTWASDSPAARKWYIMLAKQTADWYTMVMDCAAQAQVALATWSLGMWEDQLGVPTVNGLTINQRRELLFLRKHADLSRKGLVDAIRAVVPNLTVTATYDQWRVDIKIHGAPNAAIRRALEEIINERKPIGVRVVVSYSQFIAGVSLSGDSL